MISYLVVGAGGALGAMARHGVNAASMRLLGPGMPYGTLIVNVVGSFAMGLLIAALLRDTSGQLNHFRLFFATGVLGGFTTFSAFSLDAVNLFQRGELGLAVGYVLLSVVISIAALVLGLSLGRFGAFS